MVNLLSFFQIIFIILIILVILTQNVSLKIVKLDNFLLEFNFTFFAFSVIPGKSKKRKQKNQKKSSPRERLLTYSLIIKTLKVGLSRSHLKVKELHLGSPPNSEKAYLVKALLNIPRDTALAYLESISASFEYTPQKNDASADVEAIIYTPLYHLIVTLAYYFKERHKSKHKARANP